MLYNHMRPVIIAHPLAGMLQFHQINGHGWMDDL